MTARRRQQLRENDLGKPGPLNEVLMDLYRRLEALERVTYYDLTVTTDTASSASVSFAKPDWPVRAVYLAKLFNVTTSNDDYLSQSLMWHATEKEILIPVIFFSSASSKYQMTLEVRG